MANKELSEITQIIVEDMTILLEYVGIYDIFVYNDRISFSCPIHESDNPESLSVFTTGHTKIGNWKCWTQGCEEEILTDGKPRGNSLYGLIRGLLSVKHEREVGFGEAIKTVKDLYGIKSDTIDRKYGDDDYKEKSKFISNTKVLQPKFHEIKGTLSREEVRAGLVIPSQYFLGRGFDAETLDKYDVGYCDVYGETMYQRAVAPVYDIDHKLIGQVGRTTKPICTECKFHHDFKRHCPQNDLERKWGRKWINSTGFKADTFIYNYWYAKPHIESTGWAILVEGQGDVWKLEMAGYHIGLGIFGDSLGDYQKLAIDELGALNLLILTDNDKAGMAARNKIGAKCNRYYNCYYMDLPKKDLGEMKPVEIQKFLEPMLGGKL